MWNDCTNLRTIAGGKKPEKWRFDVRIIDASFGPTVEKKSLKTFGNCAGSLVIWPFDHRGLKQQFGNNGGNGSENVTQKVNLSCFKLFCSYSISFNLSNVVDFFSRVEFWRTVSKFTKRKGKSLSCNYVLNKTWNEMYGTKAWCTCKLVFWQSKPIVFLPFSLSSPSTLLKLSNNSMQPNTYFKC